jgi:hypothetical protein
MNAFIPVMPFNTIKTHLNLITGREITPTIKSNKANNSHNHAYNLVGSDFM